MRTEIVSQEKNLVAIKAEVDVDEFQKSINKTINELSHKVSIAGFRKGKVPRKVLELRYGKGTLLTEALEDMAPDIISEIIRDYELELIEEPKLEIESMEEGKPLILKFIFQVVPEITLPEISSLEVEKLKVQVTEDMVNETIDNILANNATFETVEDRATTSEEDLVEISYETRILDEERNVLKSHEPSKTILDLNQEGLKEEISSALTGIEVGNKVEIDTRIDEGYPEKDMVGKTAHYSIELLSIKKKVLPAVEKEFISKVAGKELETETQFREYIRDMIIERMEKESLNACQNSAIQKIADVTQVDIPDNMIERQLENLKKQDEENIRKQFDKSLLEFLEETSMDPHHYEGNLRTRAENQVKRYLVIEALAKEHQISVDQQDIDQEIDKIASQYNVDIATIKGSLLRDQDKLRDLSDQVRYGKILDLVMEQIKIKEVLKLSSEDAEVYPEDKEQVDQ